MAVALGTLFTVALVKHNAELDKIESIPNINLTTIDGEGFCLSENTQCRHTAILFFSTDCEFCRKEIEGIINARETLSGVNWIFVTISVFEELDSFMHEYPLFKIENAKICIEEYPELHMALDVSSPPSLFIYDSNGHIEYYKRGAVSINTILEWLK